MSLVLVALLASLHGSVVQAGTDVAVPKAVVELRPMEDSIPAPYRTLSSIDGTFSFKNVKSGRYRLSASRNGYAANGGPILTIAAEDNLTDLRIALTLTAAISGRVYDQNHKPLANADVQAMKVAYEAGRRVIKYVQSATTNDLGEYRLFGLIPGRYYVAALHPDAGRYRPPGGTPPGNFTGGFLAVGRRPTTRPLAKLPMGNYVPVFFPGSTDEWNAEPIDLAAGANLHGNEITMFPAVQRVVRGTIIDGNSGQPARNARLFVTRSPVRINDSPYIGVDSTGGMFEVSSLLPGSYVLTATAGPLSGRAAIDVNDANLEGVAIILTNGFTIAGRVVTDRGDSVVAGVQINLEPDPPVKDLRLPGPSDNGIVGRDGRFNLLSVPPGAYTLSVSLPSNLPNTYLKSVQLGADDVLTTGLQIAGVPSASLEVTLGTNPGTVEGQVVNRSGQVAPRVTVAVVPSGNGRRRLDLYRSTAADASGKFRFDRLPAGEYKLFAWEQVETGAWTDPDFLSSYEELGTPIRVLEGSILKADPTLISTQP